MESIIKRPRLLDDLPLSPPSPENAVVVVDESSNSGGETEDTEILNVSNSLQHGIDNVIILNSDDEDADDDINIDIMSDIPPTLVDLFNAFISSPLMDSRVDTVAIQEQLNNDEIIDLTEDEADSGCCLSNQQEQTTSHNNDDDDQCPVCLETFSDLQCTGVNLVISQCQHVMCMSCSCRMALAAIQASYDDDDDNIDTVTKTTTQEQDVEDQMAVMNDPAFSVMSKIKLNLTPAIAIQPADTSSFLDIKAREVLYNPKYEDMYAPVFGPADPNLSQQQRAFKNVLNGYAESTTLSDFQFENQRRTFDSFGYAVDPTVGEHATPQIIGNQTSAEINQGMTIFETTKKRIGEKRKKEKNYDSSDVEGFQGPWAPFADEITVSRPPEEEQKEIDEYLAKRRKAKRPTLDELNAAPAARDPESTTLNKEPEDSS
ncbi:unnamed protein product, partial [Adineta ricciae]